MNFKLKPYGNRKRLVSPLSATFLGIPLLLFASRQALVRGEQPDGAHLPRSRTGVADLGVDPDPGNITKIDVQRASTFAYSPTLEREGEGSEEDQAARDDGERDEVVGEVLFHDSVDFLWRGCPSNRVT